MNTGSRTFLSLAAALAAWALPGLAPAQGLHLDPHPDRIHHPHPHRPRPSVELTDVRVKVRIRDGAATTELRQTFANRGHRQAEGTWLLPLPDGTAVDRFTMTVGGVEVQGEVLDAGKARSIYEEIVRRKRDPGLLEYLGHGCLRARVFPIPAQGKVEVVVRYSQVLGESAGFYEWSFPLRAVGVDGHGAAHLALDAEILSSKPIKNVYSPLKEVDIARDGEHGARVSLELTGGRHAPRDLSLFYGLAESDFGLNLLTWRKAHEPGFFLMMLSPKRDWPEPENTYRSITFVLDTSGSMSGEKIAQARGALRTFLGSLSSKDRFNVVPFSTEARPFFDEPVLASGENIEKALARAAELQARGGTNIEEALGYALSHATPDCFKPAEGPTPTLIPITVFLTDGLPTVGTTDVDTLLAQTRQTNTNKARVFVFGVGHDVNTRFLDTLAEDTRGARDYVRPGEDIEIKTDALFRKLHGPVMIDVEVAMDGVEAFDLFPRKTPDLFQSSTLVFVGRYRGEGSRAVRLSGKVDGAHREYVFEATFPGKAVEHDFLPTLWAQRKVAFLLDQIRLNGRQKELMDEVVRLGKEYGIVTPYTSHLILEEGQQVARARGIAPGAQDFFLGMDDGVRLVVAEELARAGLTAPSVADQRLLSLSQEADREAKEGRRRAQDEAEVGEESVAKSVDLDAMSKTVAYGVPSGMATSLTMHRIRDRNFFLVKGVWVDQGFEAGMRERVEKVVAFSEEYFELLRQSPELAPFFAFTTRLILVDGDRVLEIVP